MGKRLNKFLLLFCASLFLATFVLGFSSCGGGCAGCFGIENATESSTEETSDGHAWAVKEVLQDKSCTQDGIVIYTCADCGEDKTKIEKASGHSYGEWETIQEADCFVNGEQKRRCSTCGEEVKQIIPKTAHTYQIESTETIDGVEYTQYICGLCDDGFTVQNTLISTDAQVQEPQYVFDCASDFTFDVICYEGEEYIRENLSIIDAYYDGSEYETNENVICEYTVTETEENVWRVAPVKAYKAGYSYKAKRSGDVIFKDYGWQDVTFYIEKEETNVVELNEGVIFLQTLENANPGYYPYATEYSETSGTYWLTLGKVDGLQEGDIICVGTAESLEDVLSGEVDENLFGKIVSIKRPMADGDYLLELEHPPLSELYASLDIYATEMKPIVSEDFEEQIQAEAVKSLYESDSFAGFLASTYQGSMTYLADNNLTTTVNKLDSFLKNIKITPTIPDFDENDEIDDFTIGVTLDGNIKIPIYQDTNEETKTGDIIISFHSGISMRLEMLLVFRYGLIEITNKEQVPENLEDVNFLFTLTQTTTTEFKFYLEITSGEEATGKLKDEVAAAIKGGNLEEMKAAVKEKTKTLNFDETLDVGKALEKEPLLTIPLGSSGGVVEFKLDIYTEFDLYAAFNYDYKLVTVNVYGVQLGKDAMSAIEQEYTKEKTNAITMVGYMYIESGIIGHFTLATKLIDSEKMSVGIDAKVGPYVEVTGGGYWDFAGSGEDNFLKGEIVVGIHYDIDATYAFFGLEEKTGNKVNILEDKEELERKYAEYLPDDEEDSSSEDSSDDYEEDSSSEDSSDDYEDSSWDEGLEDSSEVEDEGSEGLTYEWLLELVDDKAYACLGVSNCGSCIDTEIIIPDKFNGDFVRVICDSAFENCGRITSVVLPQGMLRIGEKAFYDCTSLTSIIFEGTVSQWNAIKKETDWNKNIPAVKVICSNGEVSLKEDNNDALTGSVGLEYTLSDDGTYYIVTGIGTCADTDIVIPSMYNDLPVTSIGDEAFYSCDSLTSVTIGDSVTSIGVLAFYNCTSLTSIEIPDSVTWIGWGAFHNCSSLTSVTIPDSVTEIVSYAFYDCENLMNITVDENNADYSSLDGNLYNKDQTMLIQYAIGKKDTFFVIPDSVTSIGAVAFACCGLTEIVIPNSVMSIDYGAFEYCNSLTSVTISDSVTNIGELAFSGCNSLTNIIVDENNADYSSLDGNLYNKDQTMLIQYAIGKTDTSFVIPNSVTSIGDWAFFDCDSLMNVTIPNGVTNIGNSVFLWCDRLTSITIPSSVTSIDVQAFSGCGSLTSVTIPDSVTSICSASFAWCNSLASVTFKGTVAEWNAIEKGGMWNYGVPAMQVICSDGTVAL